MVEWLESFKPHDVFLDIGANVGTYTIPAAFLCDLVIAIELDPNNISCLYSNIHYNKLYNKVIIVPFAAGKEKCVIDIHYRDFSIGDALQSIGREQVLPTNQPSPHILRQLCIPIDSLFRDFALPKPTKIKIDVDGNELLVLEGAWEIVSGADEIYYEDNGLDEDIYILNKLIDFDFEIFREIPASVGSVKSDIARNLLLRKK
jgi:FkbM family methyltransferase